MNPRKIKVIKANARENLLGNYTPIIAATLLIGIIYYLVSSFFGISDNNPMQYVVFYAADFIIAMLVNLFYVGIYAMHLNAARGEKNTIEMLLYPIKNGTNRFLIVAAVMTCITLIQGIPLMLLRSELNVMGFLTGTADALDLEKIYLLGIITAIAFVVSIVLSFTFGLAYYLLIDNPQMSAKEALASSYHYMKGNKLRLLFLHISFAFLYVLGVCTFGLAFLWITPYRDQSVAVFYKTIVPENNEEHA